MTTTRPEFDDLLLLVMHRTAQHYLVLIVPTVRHKV